MKPIIVQRSAAMGDIIQSFVVTNQLSAAGFEVAFSCHPMFHCIVALNPKLTIADDSDVTDINLDGAYESHPDRKTRHMRDLYCECARQQYSSVAFDKWREFSPTLNKKTQHSHNKSVMICPRSSTRWEDGLVSGSPSRTVPDAVWWGVSQLVKHPCCWLGIHAPAPDGMIDLNIKNLDEMIAAVSAAAALVSVDTGPAYLAEAMGVPLVVIGQSHDPKLRLSHLTAARIIYPPLDCLNCQTTPCPIDATSPPCQSVSATAIADAVNATIDEL